MRSGCPWRPERAASRLRLRRGRRRDGRRLSGRLAGGVGGGVAERAVGHPAVELGRGAAAVTDQRGHGARGGDDGGAKQRPGKGRGHPPLARARRLGRTDLRGGVPQGRGHGRRDRRGGVVGDALQLRRGPLATRCRRPAEPACLPRPRSSGRCCWRSARPPGTSARPRSTSAPRPARRPGDFCAAFCAATAAFCAAALDFCAAFCAATWADAAAARAALAAVRAAPEQPCPPRAPGRPRRWCREWLCVTLSRTRFCPLVYLSVRQGSPGLRLQSSASRSK